MATPIRDYAEKPYSSVVAITPDMADRWLKANATNRNLRKAQIDRYARDMLAGQWRITGEGVKFSADGKLLDGQHRLHAIIKSGCTVLMFVFRGIDPEAQSVMDSGAGRTASDNVYMQQGKENAVIVTSVARLAIRRDLGGEKWSYSPTNSEIYSWINAHPEVDIAAHIAARFRKNTDVTPGLIGFTAWLIGSSAGFAAAEEFWELASTRVGLYPSDPVNAMVNAFAEIRRKRTRVSETALVSGILRAYNARQSGKTMKLLRFTYSDRGATDQHKPVAIPDVIA